MIPWQQITLLIIIMLVALLLAFVLGALAAGGGLSQFTTNLTAMGTSWAPGSIVKEALGGIHGIKHRADDTEASSAEDGPGLHVLQGGLPTREDAQPVLEAGLPVLRRESDGPGEG